MSSFKYRKHSSGYISNKWRIVVGILVSKEKRKSKYGEDYYLLKLKVANKLTDLYCQINWKELGQQWGEFEHTGYPYTQHYSFISIDRSIFDFNCDFRNLEINQIYIFEYYRNQAGFPQLISARIAGGEKRYLEKEWAGILAEQRERMIEILNSSERTERIQELMKIDTALENIKDLNQLREKLIKMERVVAQGLWELDLHLIIAKHRQRLIKNIH